MLKEVLPNIYHHFFENEILDFPIKEKKATCDSCALSNGKSPDKRNYNPNLKCCTFQPFQTNFALGQILEDENTNLEIKNKIQSFIENGEYALPIGILANIPKQIEFNQNKKKFFGNKEEWLCPYYDKLNNNCGIWKYRNSVCTSFHCLSSYKENGFEFWESLEDYISYTEMILMEESMSKLGFSAISISEQTFFLDEFRKMPKEKFSTSLPKEYLKTIWRNYFSKEVEFYKKCAEIVKNYNKRKFKNLLGEKGKELEKKLISIIKNFKL